MNKRALSFVLILALLLGIMPTSVFAGYANGSNAGKYIVSAEVIGTSVAGQKFEPIIKVNPNFTAGTGGAGWSGMHNGGGSNNIFYFATDAAGAANLDENGYTIDQLGSAVGLDYNNLNQEGGAVSLTCDFTYGKARCATTGAILAAEGDGLPIPSKTTTYYAALWSETKQTALDDDSHLTFVEFVVDKNGNLVQPHAATITPSDKLEFSETVGYSSPAAKNVKVENTGVNDLYASYKLQGTSPSAFVLTTPAAMANAITSKGSIELKVNPAAGLAAGTYNAVLDVFVSTDSAIAGTETSSVTGAVTQASISLKLDVNAGEKLKIVTLPTFDMTYGTSFGAATVTNKGSVTGVTHTTELVEKGAWNLANPTVIPPAGTTTASVTFTLTDSTVDGVTYEKSITTDVSISVKRKAISGAPTIGGNTAVGGILTSSALNVNPEAAQAGLTYEWFKNNVSTGVTKTTYQSVSLGDKITLKVTGTGNYTGTSDPSNEIEIGKIALTGIPTIQKTTLTPGSILTASIISMNAGAADLDFQWYSSGTAVGTNSSTYALQSSDLGKNITVKVTAKGNYTGEATSAATAIPALAPDGLTAALKAGNASATATWSVNANGAEATYYYKLTFNDPGTVIARTKYVYEMTSGGTTGSAIVTDSAVAGYIFTSPAGVEWIDPAGTGLTSGAVYKVVSKSADPYTSGAGITVKETGDTTLESKVFSGLTNGVEYTLEVYAKNSVGTTAAVTASAIPKSSGGGNHGGGGGGGSTTTYTVTYDPGSHGTIEQKTESVADGSSPKGVVVKATDGWKFVGWSKDGKTVINLKDIKVTGSLTLKAVYQEADAEPTSQGFNKDWTQGYISGYPDGSFRADMGTTRAEVASMIAKILKDKMGSTTYTSQYSDLSGHWAANSIGFLSDLGVVSGYLDGSFQPDKLITRAEFVTMVMRVDGIVSGDKSFRDVDNAYWAKQYIVAAAEKQYVDGYEDGTFRPETAITRAESVAILNAVLNWSETKAGSGKTFTDLTNTHWAYDQIMKAANGLLK